MGRRRVRTTAARLCPGDVLNDCGRTVVRVEKDSDPVNVVVTGHHGEYRRSYWAGQHLSVWRMS